MPVVIGAGVVEKYWQTAAPHVWLSASVKVGLLPVERDTWSYSNSGPNGNADFHWFRYYGYQAPQSAIFMVIVCD
jgi:hypothetical protein